MSNQAQIDYDKQFQDDLAKATALSLQEKEARGSLQAQDPPPQEGQKDPPQEEAQRLNSFVFPSIRLDLF